MMNQKDYVQQILLMAKIIQEFALMHQGGILLIEFPPDKVFLAATMAEAEETRLIALNDLARGMIQYVISHFPEEQEPTVMMFKCALHVAFEAIID